MKRAPGEREVLLVVKRQALAEEAQSTVGKVLPFADEFAAQGAAVQKNAMQF